MKRTLSFLLLLGLLLPVVRAADAPAAMTTAYADLDQFVGGTWVAKLPPQKDRPDTQIALRFARHENGHGIRFDSAWIIGGKTSPYTNGMYVWNGAKKSLVMVYTDSSGSLTEGTVTREGNVFVHELTLTKKDGGVDPIRVRLTKVDADAFTNEIFLMQNGTWAKFVEVRYERQK